MSQKYALIIGNTEYTDPALAQLTAPGKDAEDFARVLRDQDLGAFDDVKVLLNEPSHTVVETIDEFFAQRKPDDLLVVYFSGHGVRDELGALFLAVKNTARSKLRSTAIRSDYIRESMEQSRSKRQVLILDCCNSGAFPQGTKAEVGGAMGMVAALQGYGRFVLTASDATQFAWEGNKIIGETQNSLFTHFLVKGLEGEADSDGDGKITVDELYDYAYEQISKVTPKQTPTKSSSRQEGEIVLRQIVRLEDIKPIPLPVALLDSIDNPFAEIRLGAVQQLRKLLTGKNLGLARSAREALERIAQVEDSRQVSQAALQALEEFRSIEQLAPNREERRVSEAKPEVQRSSQQRPLARAKVATSPDGIKKNTAGTAPRARNFSFLRVGTMGVVLIAIVALGYGATRIYSLVSGKDITPAATQPALVPTDTNASSPSKSLPTSENTPLSIPATQVLASAPTENIPITGPTNASHNLGEQKQNSDGVTLLYVPPGKFTMGLTEDQVNMLRQLCSLDDCEQLYQASMPAHNVELTKGYWIYRTEVSNAQYARCVNAADCNLPRADASGDRVSYYTNPTFSEYPVVSVDWDQANAYCKWAGGRLPTSAEWEKAASWNEVRQEKSVYPWGNFFDGTLLNYCDQNCSNSGWADPAVNDGYADTAPVESYSGGASPYGALNMAGNAWEWTADWFSSTYYRDNTDWTDPKGPPGGTVRVGRGGSFYIRSALASVTIQDWEEPNSPLSNYDYDGVGFRCVVDE